MKPTRGNMEKGVEKEVGWSTKGKGRKGRVSQTQRAGRSHSMILTLVETPPFSSAPMLFIQGLLPKRGEGNIISTV